MTAGNYRHRITVEKKVSTGQSSSGAEQYEWQPVFSTRAKYQSLSVRDFVAAAASQTQISGQFTIRYRELTAGEYRLIWRNTIYSILDFLPDEQSGRKTLTLPVKQQI